MLLPSLLLPIGFLQKASLPVAVRRRLLINDHLKVVARGGRDFFPGVSAFYVRVKFKCWLNSPDQPSHLPTYLGRDFIGEARSESLTRRGLMNANFLIQFERDKWPLSLLFCFWSVSRGA